MNVFEEFKKFKDHFEEFQENSMRCGHMSKFKVGDMVKVREDVSFYNGSLSSVAGKSAVITDYDAECSVYKLNIDDTWWFSSSHLEKYQETLDNINPKHYKQGKYEVINVIKGQLTREQYIGYLLGNIWKYTMRFEHKNGVEDVKKAEWYIGKLIEVMTPKTD